LLTETPFFGIVILSISTGERTLSSQNQTKKRQFIPGRRVAVSFAFLSLMSAMEGKIRQKHTELVSSQTRSRTRRLLAVVQFFAYTLLYGFHRSFFVLFTSPQRSFELVGRQREDGVWVTSYDQHVQFARHLRVFGVTSPVIIVTAAIVTFAAVQLLFPLRETPEVQAASFTCAVTSYANAGAGSLRSCINFANSKDPGDDITIELGPFGAPPGTVTLATPLPIVTRQVTFENQHAFVAITVNGSGLGVASACLAFEDDASDSHVEGIAFRDCPTGIRVADGTALSGLTIGSGTGLDGRVHIYGGTTGLFFGDSVSSSQIRNLVVGERPTGVNSPLTGSGVTLRGSSILVRDSEIGNATEGIFIQGDNNVVRSSFIGIGSNNENRGNSDHGILVQGNDNTIGSLVAAERNIVSFNTDNGIAVIQDVGDPSPTGNTILANRVGTLTGGAAVAANGTHGIFLSGDTNTVIGDSAANIGPLVSGNTQAGIFIENSTSPDVLESSIGLSSTQEVLAGNPQDNGLLAQNSTDVTVRDNLVSGNTQDGIRFISSTSGTIAGNVVGLKADQATDRGNLVDGIVLDGAGSVTIGGPTDADRNVIAGNDNNGITANNLSGSTVIRRNRIGVASGVGNTENGIRVEEITGGSLEVRGNTIQGTTGGLVGTGLHLVRAHNAVAVNNTVRGNFGPGIFLNETDGATVRQNVAYGNGDGIRLFEADNNTIQANIVGINPISGAVSGNTQRGIAVTGDSQGNQIGGVLAVNRNIVSGHTTGGAIGIFIENLAGPGNVIKGNYVGTTIGGQAAAANTGGIKVEAPSQAVHNNVISGNTQHAIEVFGDDVTVRDNLIGVAADERTPLKNGGTGIALTGADNAVLLRNRIANNRSGIKLDASHSVRIDGNTINRHEAEGINIFGGSTGTVIVGNRIGITPNGDLAGNAVGISIKEGANDIRIGSIRSQEANVGARNTISFNRLAGIAVNGAASTGVLISRNTMTGNGDGVRDNIVLLNGANNGIQPPVITEVTVDRVRGSNALPNGTVQLFRNGIYVGQDLFPQASGRWSVRLQQTISAAALSTIQFAAINIAPNGSTSAFSKPEGGPQSNQAQQEEPTKSPSFTVETHGAPGSTTGQLTVITSVPTTVEVRYGTEEFNLADSVSSLELATEHFLSVTNLEPNTKYYYQVTATDESGDAVVTAVASFTTTPFDVQYLFTDTTVNGQRVYDRKEVLYVNPNRDVRIRVGEVNPDHEVKLSVKEENPTGTPIVQAKPYQSGADGLVGGSFPVQKGKLYRARAKVRQAADPAEQTPLKRIASFSPTAPAPHITSLSGPFTITPNSRRLTFAGDAGNRQGQFRIVNYLSGAEVAVGQTNADGVYELPFDLKVGDYTVNFEGLLNDGSRTAPRQHRLFVADPRSTTTVLNTDSRNNNPAYHQRLVSARTGTVTVVAISDLEAKLLVDGKDLGFMTRTSPVGLEGKVDLHALGFGPGDHVVEIQRFSADAKPYGARLWHPFKIIPGVVTPVVQLEDGATFTQHEAAEATVLGGKNDRLNVYRDGVLIQSQIIPDDGSGGVIGSVQITLPTDQLGEEVLTVQAENSFGARSVAVEARYKVTAQQFTLFAAEPAAEAEPETTEPEAEPEAELSAEPDAEATTEPDGAVTPPAEEPSEEPTEEPTIEPGEEPSAEPEPTEPEATGPTTEVIPPAMVEAEISPTVLVPVPVASAELPDELLADIPQAFLLPVTDPAAVQALYEQLNEQNQTALTVNVEHWVIDPETGQLVSAETVEPGADGKIILRRQKLVGLPQLRFLPVSIARWLERLPFFADPSESDVLVLSGTAEPYAKVVVVILSEPVVKVTRADANGQWTMTVNVDDLPPGEHTAYLHTEAQGVRSDQLEIARFVVVEERQLSNTTWVIIVNMAVAAGLLVVTISLQIRSRRVARRLGVAAATPAQETPPATPIPPTTQTPPTEPSTPAEPTKPEEPTSPEEPSNRGGALGV
jgi:parallel beta-helix repeat protein